MTGSAFSIGLVFLIFSALLPAEVVVVLFSGSTNSTHQDSIQFNDTDLDRFILSIQAIFIISAILMVTSVLIQRNMR